jgi:signal peptidase II
MTESASPAESDPPTAKAGAGASKKWILFAIVTVLSLAADQISKIWARGSLPTTRIAAGVHNASAACTIPDDIVNRMCVGHPVPVIDGFWEWRLSMNPGSAFGLFSSQDFARIMLSVIGVAAVVGMLWILRRARPDQTVLHWALALVAGGAIGNLIDRIYFGVVTDFILWRHNKLEWPVFNVADVVLVVGVILMFVDIQKESRREKSLKQTGQSAAKAKGLVKTF